jgi:DNA-binding beta-propeller fold protein YncE
VALSNLAVSDLAGDATAAGTTDATGSAARFSLPVGLAIDMNGIIYVADSGNNLIRRVTTSGVVTTLAGVAGICGNADGVGTAASFCGPRALSIAGNLLYVADTRNSVVRAIDLTTAAVATFAGVPGVRGVRAGALPGGLNLPFSIAALGPSDVVVGSLAEPVIVRARDP